MNPSTLYCPACGINRHWQEEDPRTDPVDEAVYRCVDVPLDAVLYDHLCDHWPGTGMGLQCPRCGVEAAPTTTRPGGNP